MPYRMVSVCTQCRGTTCVCIAPKGWVSRIRRYVPHFWEVLRDMKERVKQAGGPGGTPAKGFLSDYPSLWEMMTADTYDTGKRRRRSTVLMMCDGALFKLLLLDKDTGEQAWFAAESPDGALSAAEEQIRTGMVSWQTSQAKGGGGRTR